VAPSQGGSPLHPARAWTRNTARRGGASRVAGRGTDTRVGRQQEGECGRDPRCSSGRVAPRDTLPDACSSSAPCVARLGCRAHVLQAPSPPWGLPHQAAWPCARATGSGSAAAGSGPWQPPWPGVGGAGSAVWGGGAGGAGLGCEARGAGSWLLEELGRLAMASRFAVVGLEDLVRRCGSWNRYHI